MPIKVAVVTVEVSGWPWFMVWTRGTFNRPKKEIKVIIEVLLLLVVEFIMALGLLVSTLNPGIVSVKFVKALTVVSNTIMGEIRFIWKLPN